MPERLKYRFIFQARSVISGVERLTLHSGRDLPVGVDIETNSECSRKCYYCPRPEGREDVMESEIFYSLIDQLRDWDFKGRLTPSGYNEPLTDDRIFDFLDYVSKQLPHSDRVLFTNGDFLDGEKLRRLEAAGLDKIIVSFHSPLSEEKERNLRNLAEGHGNVTIADYRDGHRRIPLQNRGGLVELGEIRKYRPCFYINEMSIRASGNVTLCCNDANEEHVFGNVHETPLRAIWDQPEFKKLRQEIRAGKYTNEMCRACGYEKV